jgi:heme exporter protein B
VASAARRRPGWVGQVLIVAGKDLAIELSTGEIVTTSGFFAVLVLVLTSISFYLGPTLAPAVAPGALWVAIAFASVLALSRTWQREREDGALVGLLSLPLSRSAIFAGKALGVAAFVLAVELLLVPLTALLFSLDLGKYGLGMLLFTVAATPGIAASGTLFGAMTVKTRARELVLATVLFPMLAPTLLAGAAGTRDLLADHALATLGDYFMLIGVFGAVFLAGGLGLFESLIEG